MLKENVYWIEDLNVSLEGDEEFLILTDIEGILVLCTEEKAKELGNNYQLAEDGTYVAESGDEVEVKNNQVVTPFW